MSFPTEKEWFEIDIKEFKHVADKPYNTWKCIYDKDIQFWHQCSSSKPAKIVAWCDIEAVKRRVKDLFIGFTNTSLNTIIRDHECFYHTYDANFKGKSDNLSFKLECECGFKDKARVVGALLDD